ncbi:MAG: phosphoenolpyruvate--protein phosphotransferase [Treponema sp.]|jgi:phosphotransferase system enzyme I (PtsI)|nr:phosphoenolpyruvate--protein phosphotransferase [Treponema sp.]
MVLNGKGAAAGIAVGSILIYNDKIQIPCESFVPAGGEQAQLDKYNLIKKEALEELESIRLSIQKLDPAKAGIFIAHKEIVEDIVINEEITAKILKDRWVADWAVYSVYDTFISVLRQTPDPMISERAVDFEDVRDLLLRLLYGQKKIKLSSLNEPVIIAAGDFKPSDAASMDKEKVLAILSEHGGLTSHTAIIAKSYGIPAVFGIEGLLKTIKQGQSVIVDAGEGIVILDPPSDAKKKYEEKYSAFCRDREDAEKYRTAPGCTSCGVKIDIGLNIANTDDKELSASGYTDSVGVFRTEFIYMGRAALPAEDEQFSIYKKVLECFKERPVILRTMDIGGDKKLSCMELPDEENPFLGNRALRFCFKNPDIFKTHIRACLRASVFGHLWLMLPMVTSLEDIRKAKEHIACARSELEKEGKSFKEIKLGIMIEIPSVAIIADLVCAEVDFASIGSNDLIQYVCAADRMNVEVEPYYQSYHPAMFRLFKKTIDAFNDAGKPVSFCGELGSDPKAVPALIGLGMRKLSMNAACVPAVKRTIASLTIKKAEEIAANVLRLPTAMEIEKYLQGAL